MSEFFSMGGYGAYVWSAYTLTAIVLATNVVVTRRAHRDLAIKLAARHAEKGRKS